MNTPPPPPADQPSSPPAKQRRWPLWLGIGFFGVVTVALVATLANIWTRGLTPSVAKETPTAVPDEAAPADLKAHQQLVSEVVNDLDRQILIGESPTRGNPDAEVVLFEFSDFQCPYCAQATTEVEAFLQEHSSEVLFVYKHLPLTSIHPQALPAALAAWAAGQQDQFWAFHDALFANQDRLGDPLYEEIAAELGLDMDQFERDRASESAQIAIARDLALAAEFQLRSTPTFIMNNLLIPGAVPAEFLAEALMRLQSAPAEGTSES